MSISLSIKPISCDWTIKFPSLTSPWIRPAVRKGASVLMTFIAICHANGITTFDGAVISLSSAMTLFKDLPGRNRAT